MFRLFLYILLCFFLPASSFAALNQSTKPQSITVYLDQNLPYSGFDSSNQAKGLYAQYWKAWSLNTDIKVNFSPYQKQDLVTLLSTNALATYSHLTSSTDSALNFNKIALLDIETDFYFRPFMEQKIAAAIENKKTTITVGGLIEAGEKLLVNRGNIKYKQYPGFLELLLDLYTSKIDALVIYNIGTTDKGIIGLLLKSLLKTTYIDGTSNQLSAYLSVENELLYEWIEWGAQFKNDTKMQSTLVSFNNPLWGASETMMRYLIIILCLFVLVIIFKRSKRRKDSQFKDVLDSSPYPLAIFSLDGNTIFYLNDEVKSLFPFKKKNKKFLFEETENQLLLSRFINKVSHQSIIENGLVRLLVNDRFHDIEVFAKRIHYQGKTVWLCHLKDVTALLSVKRKLIEERELLRKVLDSLPEQIAFKSPKGTIIGCNTAWAEANQTTVSHATGRSIADMMPATAIKKQKQQETSAWNGETYNTQEWVNQNSSLEMSLVNITKVPLYNDKGSIFAILSIDSDITALHNLTKQLEDENLQRKETEKALAKQSVLLSTVFAASYDPIALLDHEGRIIGANNSFAKLMNTVPDDIVGKLQTEVVTSDRADWAERQNNEVLDSEEPIIFEELMFIGDKKVWYEVHKVPFKDDDSRSKGIVIMARDITTHKLTEEKLNLDATEFEQKMLHDPLTNIANRRAFDEHFKRIWDEAANEQELLSLVMCDVDYFKPYNDNYGHQMGDEALKIIASTLHETANSMGCFAARYGGEEFIITIKGGNATKVLRAVEKLREAVNKTEIEHLHSDVSHHITVSLGLSSIFPSDLNTMKMLVAEADAALYDAKMSGRNQISVHE